MQTSTGLPGLLIALKNRYNLLYREEEREMTKFCNATDATVIPVMKRPGYIHLHFYRLILVFLI
ncbi:hypothetical protein N7510_009592 [Penicillium lagena]|uniref:uncharacterized protein n=1 Tax=Penicillium lagena TaxID=94218 RepID=UPI002541BE41|nr:uncharacterized protein N7510_009592 [Penicillium lagena]KAJ5604438.1 hypothetical protein N7510_009592 [Penicillium lagena]